MSRKEKRGYFKHLFYWYGLRLLQYNIEPMKQHLQIFEGKCLTSIFYIKPTYLPHLKKI